LSRGEWGEKRTVAEKRGREKERVDVPERGKKKGRGSKDKKSVVEVRTSAVSPSVTETGYL